MENEVDDTGHMVIEPERVLQAASKGVYDQIAIIGRVGDKMAIFSSHCADAMDDMIDEALYVLYEEPDRLADPVDEE